MQWNIQEISLRGRNVSKQEPDIYEHACIFVFQSTHAKVTLQLTGFASEQRREQYWKNLTNSEDDMTT